MTTRGSRTVRCLRSAVAVVLATLLAPGATLAADEPVTGPAVAGAALDPAAWLGAFPDPGPLLLLLVAVTLGVLAVLSGPAEEPHATPAAPSTRSSERRP